MITFLLSLSVSLAHGSQLPAAVNIRMLHDTILESVENEEKDRALIQLAATPPASLRDLPLLYDIFMRMPSQSSRAYVLESIGLLGPKNSYLEPGFMEFLKLPEPEGVLFGIKGLTRLKSQRAVPELKRIIKGRFKAKSVEDLSLPGQRNEWWLHYEALDALAIIEGPKAFDLVKSKVDETPVVARIMASRYWKKTLPLIIAWSKSSSNVDRAHEALRASGTTAELRETREMMLSALRDPKVDREVRHQLALKVGVTSQPAEVTALLKERETAVEPDLKLMLLAALFASHDDQIVPLLKQQAAANPDPQTRLGCLVQLKDMVAPASFKLSAEAMVKDDPDPDNRKEAAALLK